MGKILVVDDQRNMRTTLAMMLRGGGYEVDEAADGAQGRELGATGAYDVVITDLRMGEFDGIDVLRATKEKQPMTEVIVMTAYGTIESAVEAMRVGAFDYIQKPFSEQELIVKVSKAFESRRLHGQVQLFAQEFKERYHLEKIIGRSQSIRDVLTRVVKIAPTDAIVLITGESGTGKELVARAVHANSKRAHRPFVTVNCAAISETLLESELFGHARGAFTGAVSARKGLFEEADGWRYQAVATNTKVGQLAFLEARHRAHARVEDRIRHAKDSGLGRFPSREYAINQAWLQVVTLAADLTAWLRLLALPEPLKACEPKALRYRLLHVPARLTRGARRRRLRLPATWPWADHLKAVFDAVIGIPALT